MMTDVECGESSALQGQTGQTLDHDVKALSAPPSSGNYSLFGSMVAIQQKHTTQSVFSQPLFI